ncbi:hypothetical protein [Atlantibacter hermannii]|uniref:hypothetical protein n=1 Tax=Atlantibacter hermannii TaxID=565 RepID=UPI0028AFDA52|nr:hypothetical protein [Atlantibacter hermannii]
MNLKFTAHYLTVRDSSYPGCTAFLAEGAELDGTIDSREVLSQLDHAVIVDWLTEQGYSVSAPQEHAA